MKVFGWSGGKDGCEWYRLTVPYTQLAETYGWNVEISTRVPGAEHHRVADILVGQRIMTDGPSGTWRRMCADPRRTARMVYEIDDDFFSIEHSNPVSKFVGQRELDNIVANAQAADLVTVSTESLAEVMSRFNSRVAVLPNCVPTVASEPGPFGITHDVVWSGSPTHDADWRDAAEPVMRWLRASDRTLKILGALPTPLEPLRGRDILTVAGWTQDVPTFYQGLTATVGLAPLRRSQFNRSKSDVRLVELAARGIVAVATDFGPYAHPSPAFAGRVLVKSGSDWARALKGLFAPERRMDLLELQANARRWGMSRHISRNVQLWHDALISL